MSETEFPNDASPLGVGAARRTKTVEAGAFCPEFGDGRVSGLLVIAQDELRFTAEQGECSFSLKDVELRLGGANDRLLFLSTPQRPDCSVFTSDLSLLEAPALLSDERLAEAVKSVRRKRGVQFSILVGAPMLVLIALLGLWLARGAIVGVVVDRVPVSIEVQIGDLVANQLITPQQIHDPELQRTFEELVAPLKEVAADRYEYTYALVDDSTINAFALPGGRVAVNTGLVLKATSASEIQGVLAHEIAHVQQRHSLRNIASSGGLFLVVQTLFGDLTGLLAVVADGGLGLASLRFSRDFERDADDVGLDLLLRAEIDPWGLPSLLGKLRAQSEDGGAATKVAESLDFLSSHPASSERIQRLEQRLDELRIERPSFGAPQFDLKSFQNALREHLGVFEAADSESTVDAEIL